MNQRVLAMFAWLLLLTGRATAAEFPAVDKLPATADLPDPLVMLDGSKVTTKDDWVNKRRPELLKLFQHYMYGQLPASVPVSGKVRFEDAKFLDGKATLRDIALTIGKSTVDLLLIVPNECKGPAPVFVGINFAGNQATVSDPRVAITKSWVPARLKGTKDGKATEENRGSEVEKWNVDLAVERGYAVALFYNGDLDPDNPAEVGPFRPGFKSGDADDDTATIMTWAWGFHRVIDYLTTLKEIDPKRIIAVGHSRLGKTALVAAAFDERIAIAMPHQAGCGGTAPSRGKVGESVKQINERFPHWFCGNFKKFNDDTSRLPFDQNCLVALCAPRPVLFSNAKEDQWANPDGQFEVLKAAEPVYKLLGAGGLEAKSRPEPGQLSTGTLGYFYRDGKHLMTRDDWKAFLDYADKQLGKP